MTTDRISVRGIEVFGHHGVLPEERENGQLFIIDLEIRTDVSNAAATDDLEETIDALAAQDLSADAKAALEKKIAIVQRMYDFCRSVPDTWSEHDRLANTPNRP